MSTDASFPADASVSKATTTTMASSSTVSGKLVSGAVSDDDDVKSSNASELKILDEDNDVEDQDKISLDAAADVEDTTGNNNADLTQPLRIGGTKMTFESRLSTSSLSARENVLLRRKDTLSSRSGSESPLHRGNSSYTFDGGSSISSLEDHGIDTDILTDKMGVLELNLKAQQEITQSLHKSLSNLPAVNERLRDETLEDCHAFRDLKDIKREGTLSRGGSITTGGDNLEPLEEEAFEEDNVNEKTSKIKITNLAEILEAPDEEEVGEMNAGTALPFIELDK